MIKQILFRLTGWSSFLFKTYRKKEESHTTSQSSEVQKNDRNAELVAQLMVKPELLAVMKTGLTIK